jgi:ketol-acid reductoisomerase
MVKMYYDKDANLSVLKGKTIAVIGYGSQGHAQANNMRDSGVDIILGLRPTGKSWSRAEKDGFNVYSIAEATKRSDVVHILIPDTAQPATYKDKIEPNLSEGKTLGFAHGFNIHFKQIEPPPYVDVVMVAPKGPGPSVREMFVSGFGSPALIAVQQDYTGKAREKVLAMAKAIGSTKAGVVETTFKDETESDLIGEQTVLVGGVIELIRTGFEVLVELGYPKELAYFEACHELKLIVDQIYKGGITGMLRAVSDTAKYGGTTIGPNIIDNHVKDSMLKAAKRVQNGDFAKEWIDEASQGKPQLSAIIQKWKETSLEKVGRELRKMAGLQE